MAPAMAVQKELMSIPCFDGSDDETFFAAEFRAIAQAKKAIMMVVGSAAQKYMAELENQQEVLMNMGDMAIDIYVAETFLSDAMERIYLSGKHAITAFADGDMMRMNLMGLKRFTKCDPFNTTQARRNIADKLIADNAYKL